MNDNEIDDGFVLRESGMIGQEILSPNGNVVAWTVDPVLGQFICQALNRSLDLIVVGKEEK
jgi:hypothetical protein